MLDYSFTLLLAGGQWLFLIGILTFAFTVILRLWKILLAQLILFLAFWTFKETFANPVFLLIVAMQMALAVWLLIRLRIEIEGSFARRLEKTLKLPRNITKNGNAGIRDYRF